MATVTMTTKTELDYCNDLLRITNEMTVDNRSPVLRARNATCYQSLLKTNEHLVDLDFATFEDGAFLSTKIRSAIMAGNFLLQTQRHHEAFVELSAAMDLVYNTIVDRHSDSIAADFQALLKHHPSMPNIWANLYHFFGKAIYHEYEASEEKKGSGPAASLQYLRRAYHIRRKLEDDEQYAQPVYHVDSGEVFEDGTHAHTLMFASALASCYISLGKIDSAAVLIESNLLAGNDFNRAVQHERLARLRSEHESKHREAIECIQNAIKYAKIWVASGHVINTFARYDMLWAQFNLRLGSADCLMDALRKVNMAIERCETVTSDQNPFKRDDLEKARELRQAICDRMGRQ